jgi:hypothetical protein
MNTVLAILYGYIMSDLPVLLVINLRLLEMNISMIKFGFVITKSQNLNMSFEMTKCSHANCGRFLFSEEEFEEGICEHHIDSNVDHELSYINYMINWVPSEEGVIL